MTTTILLTGATGFVGRHLLSALEDAGHRVVCGSRNPHHARMALGDRDIRELDVLAPRTLVHAMKGCSAAYYLVHSMRGNVDFGDSETRAAENFRHAAAAAGLERIVYLGGVKPQGSPSKHLDSRLRTGRILREGAVPTLELRASMIVGGGGESWRIVRDLAARLPVMLLPKWLDSVSEPVAIRDVTAALARALTIGSRSAVFDIPGPERLSAREILRRTAQLLGVTPRMWTVPVVTPKLSSYWIRLVTRADAKMAEALVEGLRCHLVAEGPMFWGMAPEILRTPFDEAARMALEDEAKTLSLPVRRAETMLRGILPSRASVHR